MLNWLFKWSQTWRYVGRVYGYSAWTKDETRIEARGYYLLEEASDGERRWTLVGNPGDSSFSVSMRAAVMAWEMGGPFPEQITPDDKCATAEEEDEEDDSTETENEEPAIA